jgi:hypothetical protein
MMSRPGDAAVAEQVSAASSWLAGTSSGGPGVSGDAYDIA